MTNSMSAPGAEEVAPWVERLARVGFVAKALLYITVGILAAQAALGRSGRAADAHGALRFMLGVSFGRVILLIVAGGLLGYAVWRLVEAALDPEGRGSDPKGIALRIGSAARGLFHGGLGLAALRVALGDLSHADSEDPQYWTAQAFDLPGGELLVWLAALGVGGYGIYQFYRAWAPKLGRNLRLGGLSKGTASWIVGISRFGLAARGVVFCLIGFFLFQAAVKHDAGKAGGVRESMRALAGLGRWPFIVVGLGLVAYGIYQLVNARYRRIRVA